MKLLLRLSFTATATLNGVLRRPSVNTYNVMIRGFSAGTGNLESESKVLHRKPDERVYASRINWRCRQGLIDEAYSILSEMIDSGNSPSVDTYNDFIRGYCGLKRVHEAVGFLRTMPHRGLSPDALSYNIIIRSFCKLQELDKAFQMKAEMVHNGILPNVVTYELHIQALCQQRRLCHDSIFDLEL